LFLQPAGRDAVDFGKVDVQHDTLATYLQNRITVRQGPLRPSQRPEARSESAEEGGERREERGGMKAEDGRLPAEVAGPWRPWRFLFRSAG
jgi:hypothetical protein